MARALRTATKREDGRVTLLLSFYSSYGIVFAADSAITITEDGRTKRYGAPEDPALSRQEKLLPIKPVGINGAIVGFFGLATVGATPMDVWLREKFASPWPGAATAAAAGDYLRDELMRSVSREHRENNASGFHIGTFERRDGVDVPVMQYVSSIRHLDPATGEYSRLEEYRSEEHFPNHSNPASDFSKYPPTQLQKELRSLEKGHDFPHWFRNGDLSFAGAPWEGLRQVVRAIRQNLARHGLASPDSIEDWEKLAKLVVATAGDLYGIMGTKVNAPLIEGPYKTARVVWPPNRHGESPTPN